LVKNKTLKTKMAGSYVKLLLAMVFNLTVNMSDTKVRDN